MVTFEEFLVMYRANVEKAKLRDQLIHEEICAIKQELDKRGIGLICLEQSEKRREKIKSDLLAIRKDLQKQSDIANRELAAMAAEDFNANTACELDEEFNDENSTLVEPRCKLLIVDEPAPYSSAEASNPCAIHSGMDEDEITLFECNTQSDEVVFEASVTSTDEHTLNRIHIHEGSFPKHLPTRGGCLLLFLVFGVWIRMLLLKNLFLSGGLFKTQYVPVVFDPGIAEHQISKLQSQQQQPLQKDKFFSGQSLTDAKDIRCCTRRSILGHIHTDDRLDTQHAMMRSVYEAKSLTFQGATNDFQKRLHLAEQTNTLHMLVFVEVEKSNQMSYVRRSNMFAIAEKFANPTFVSPNSLSYFTATHCGDCSGGRANLFTHTNGIGVIVAILSLAVHLLVVLGVWFIFRSQYHEVTSLSVSFANRLCNSTDENAFLFLSILDHDTANTSITLECRPVQMFSSVT